MGRRRRAWPPPLARASGRSNIARERPEVSSGQAEEPRAAITGVGATEHHVQELAVAVDAFGAVGQLGGSVGEPMTGAAGESPRRGRPVELGDLPGAGDAFTRARAEE